jgi:hypothetical protein
MKSETRKQFIHNNKGEGLDNRPKSKSSVRYIEAMPDSSATPETALSKV